MPRARRCRTRRQESSGSEQRPRPRRCAGRWLSRACITISGNVGFHMFGSLTNRDTTCAHDRDEDPCLAILPCPGPERTAQRCRQGHSTGIESRRTYTCLPRVSRHPDRSHALRIDPDRSSDAHSQQRQGCVFHGMFVAPRIGHVFCNDFVPHSMQPA